MGKTEYERLERRFREVFRGCAPSLSDDAMHNVEHYLDVAELEMALESFLLSALEERISLSAAAKRDLLELGVATGLDKESVLRADLWLLIRPLLASNP